MRTVPRGLRVVLFPATLILLSVLLMGGLFSANGVDAVALPRPGPEPDQGSPPTAPLSLQAVPGDALVTLQWQEPASDGGSAITSYRVYRGAASGSETFLDTSPYFWYSDTAVSNGVTYYYEVSAVNADGEGPRSGEANATPAAAAPEDQTAPILEITSPEANATLNVTVTTVTGTASDETALDRVEVSTDGVTWVPATGTTSWSLSLTLAEGEHTIYVRAVDAAGNTATRMVTVTVTLPSTPDNPTPSADLRPVYIAVGVGGGLGALGVVVWLRRRTAHP